MGLMVDGMRERAGFEVWWLWLSTKRGRGKSFMVLRERTRWSGKGSI